jgi:hypothetical protein
MLPDSFAWLKEQERRHFQHDAHAGTAGLRDASFAPFRFCPNQPPMTEGLPRAAGPCLRRSGLQPSVVSPPLRSCSDRSVRSARKNHREGTVSGLARGG